MNLPDKLTSSRFVFAALILLLLSLSFPGAKSLALLLFLLATATDALDGHLARTRYGCSDFGRLMDPLADKVLVCVVLVGMVEYRLPHLPNSPPMVPAFLVSLLLAREFMVTGLRLLAVEKNLVISADKLGKWKTGLQMAAILLTLIAMTVLDDVLGAHRIAPGAIEALEHLRSVEFTFRWLVWFAMASATFITLLSGYNYFHQHLHLILPHDPSKPS